MNQHLYIDDRGRLSARDSRGRRLRSGQSSSFKNYCFPASPLFWSSKGVSASSAYCHLRQRNSGLSPTKRMGVAGSGSGQGVSGRRARTKHRIFCRPSRGTQQSLQSTTQRFSSCSANSLELIPGSCVQSPLPFLGAQATPPSQRKDFNARKTGELTLSTDPLMTPRSLNPVSLWCTQKPGLRDLWSCRASITLKSNQSPGLERGTSPKRRQGFFGSVARPLETEDTDG